MLMKVQLYFNLFLENAKSLGLKKAVKRAIFSKRTIVPVYHELNEITPDKFGLYSTEYEIALCTRKNKTVLGKYENKSRLIRAKLYLRKGYKGLILTREDRIIGDLWFTQGDVQNPRPHLDIKLLGINVGSREAYAFDMFIIKEARGGNIAGYFMAKALLFLRAMGISRVYGYYEKNNLPALWMHRLTGYKEMPPVIISRWVLYHRVSRSGMK
jgi:GNAT superfamily N-acetyltransferase